MMPRLQAEESMQFATRVGIGTGSLTQMEARTIQSRWREFASPGGRAPLATPAELGAMGIGYRVAEREAVQ
jgi:hypothetical protein